MDRKTALGVHRKNGTGPLQRGKTGKIFGRAPKKSLSSAKRWAMHSILAKISTKPTWRNW
tara:strand:- start:12048 stop:12227 length:180 start_codon:yes stop_codon:yes gene_type:complete